MKKLALRCGIVFVALAGALLAGEWAVGRFVPLPASMYELDPVLLYKPKPGARSITSTGPARARHWVTTEINAQSRRGPELEAVKSAPRVVVYGDSFVLAEDVDWKDTFVERLGAELRTDTPAEMVNSGVTGYGPDQECLKFEREADALAPDLAVFVLYSSNDFGDLVRNKMFSPDADGRAMLERYTIAPSLAADFEARSRVARRPALVRAFDRWNDQRSLRAQKAAAGAPAPYIELYLFAARDEYAEFVLERNLSVRQVWEDYYDADLAIHPEWPSSQFKRRLMRAVVARIQSECAKRGVPMVALIVPSAFDICPDFDVHINPARYPTWSPSRLTGVLVEIVQELGVPFVDLYAPFRDAGPERLYIGDGNEHWNEAGQALAARLVAALLRKRGLWPVSHVR